MNGQNRTLDRELHAHMRFPDTEEVTGSNPVSPTHETRKTSKASNAPCVTGATRTRSFALIAAWALGLMVLLAATLITYQRANAAPVEPTWQQSVVTIDDEATVTAAQAWGAPFTVSYAAQGADVSVARADAGERVEGHATTQRDGDRITSCAIVIDPALESTALLTHEVGHCLGLDHIYTQDRSVLTRLGQADREHGSATVTGVDRAALAALYSEVK